MTIDQFRLLRAGDTILDGSHRMAPRKVFKIKRVRGKPEQNGKVRVCITCSNLKQPSGETIIMVSDEIGSARFHLPQVLEATDTERTGAP